MSRKRRRMQNGTREETQDHAGHVQDAALLGVAEAGSASRLGNECKNKAKLAHYVNAEALTFSEKSVRNEWHCPQSWPALGQGCDGRPLQNAQTLAWFKPVRAFSGLKTRENTQTLLAHSVSNLITNPTHFEQGTPFTSSSSCTRVPRRCTLHTLKAQTN